MSREVEPFYDVKAWPYRATLTGPDGFMASAVGRDPWDALENVRAAAASGLHFHDWSPQWPDEDRCSCGAKRLIVLPVTPP